MDSNMQSFNYYTLQHIFSFLSWQELVKASKVCSSWSCIAMDSYLWRNVFLNNTMVEDWNQFVNLINKQEVKSLNMSGMLVPLEIQDFNVFWTKFSKAIPNATKLEALEFTNCPSEAVWDVMGSLHQLKKLNAFSVQNPIAREKRIRTNVLFQNLSMELVSDMIHLTELRISCEECDTRDWPLTTFSRLTKLKTLSLTSMWGFKRNLVIGMETDIPNLEVLEIGRCNFFSPIPPYFTTFLRKLTNLRSLRLVDCYGRGWTSVSNQCFDAIRSLKKLKKLELINIEFNDDLAQELAKCDGMTALLIIPTYDMKNKILHRHLLDCLNKLSKTLTHVVWGLTYESPKVTEKHIGISQHNVIDPSYRIHVSETGNPCNNVLIVKSKKRKKKPKDKSDDVDMGSVPSLKGFLDLMMVNVKTKVIKIPHLAINGVYLSEEFDDL